MWKIEFVDGKLRGFHKCPKQDAWALEPDGWANLTFLFEQDNFNDCIACKSEPPKELISIFKMYRKLCSSSSESLSI